MSIKNLLVATVVLATVETSTYAQDSGPTPGFRVSGGELLKLCQSKADLSQDACVFYISGVSDELILDGINRGHELLCMPQEITAGQIRDQVLLWFAKDPTNVNLPASVYVWRALLDTYPCKDAWKYLMPAPGAP